MTFRLTATCVLVALLAACGTSKPKLPAAPPCMTAEQLPPAQRALGQAKNLPPPCPRGVGPDGSRARQ